MKTSTKGKDGKWKYEYDKPKKGKKKQKKEVKKITFDEVRDHAKEKNKFNINYQVTIDNKLMEIEGILIPYNTGRDEEHEFEPTYFMDDETEQYYNDNWEKIEDEILNKFSIGNF